jgi:uncharacterized protein (TIGR02284 family)
MNQSTHILNDLVSATRDGKTFYEHAAANVKDPGLKTLFNRIAKVKGDIVRGLSDEIRAEGEMPSKTGTWTGDFHRFYGEVRAMIGERNHAYVAQLEESEDQLLKAFHRAMNDAETPERARIVISDFMPEVRDCHDLMRARKIALKHAA